MVSPVSGQVFEKRLIEKYIQENGVDPLNQQPLTVEELIELKVSQVNKWYSVIKAHTGIQKVKDFF